MKKNTILYILIIFLIVANGFFLFNYMGKSNSNRPNRHQGNKDFIVKELGFSNIQLEQVKDRSKEHHEKMRRLSDDIKALKDNLFSKLTDVGVNKVDIDSITSLIGAKQTEKEKEIFNHFKMIQDIANEEQKEKFKKILIDALQRGDVGNKPPPNGPDGHRPPPHQDRGRRPPPRNK
ncbi:hypothetical protein [uncultured Winogradskyella sp.]|uniref:hypothetical protein n=1 Tax=uncultured Winogradskyella sp. TaxID=395353 RepID=UPI0026272083|nr:hypothetical protein [uncultured Winogradskyella sp.]